MQLIAHSGVDSYIKRKNTNRSCQRPCLARRGHLWSNRLNVLLGIHIRSSAIQSIFDIFSSRLSGQSLKAGIMQGSAVCLLSHKS